MIAGAAILGTLPACEAPGAKTSVPLPPPASPFDDSPVSFLIPTPHLPSGEIAVVWVCVAADESIQSAQLLESSGDSRFDSLALAWARRVKVRSLPAGALRAPCGAVRVEVRKPDEPHRLGETDSGLG